MQTETLLKSYEDHDLVLVTAHNRAQAGEAGSSYKPISVREHLRHVYRDGRKATRVKTGFKWAPGELSAELVEAMAEVTNIPSSQLPPKNWAWTLKQATYVLNKEMRYDRKRGLWHKGVFTWAFDVENCMKIIDRKEQKADAKKVAAGAAHRAYKQGANVDTWRA